MCPSPGGYRGRHHAATADGSLPSCRAAPQIGARVGVTVWALVWEAEAEAFIVDPPGMHARGHSLCSGHLPAPG